MYLSVKKLTLALLNALVFTSLTACGSGGSDEPKPKPDPKPDPVVEEDEIKRTGGNDIGVTFDIKETGDMFTGKPYLLKYKNTHSEEAAKSDDEEDDAIKVTAKYGEISEINPLTGEKAKSGELYYYLPEEALADTPEDFYRIDEKLTVLYGKQKAVYTWSLGTDNEHGDYLFTDQWHIKNLGQNPFKVAKAPVKGIDLNVVPAWHLKDLNDDLISGKNVIVGVYDTSVDFEHEDLKAKKYQPSISEDYINKGLTLSEIKNNSSVLHGSSVSGIIAAEANNGRGVRGIAFDAHITSLDLNYEDINVSKHSFLDIINESIGYNSSYYYEPAWELNLQALAENNIPFIKAIGNSFDNVGYDHEEDYNQKCTGLGVNCTFTQNSSLERSRYQIIVGAINSLGKKSSYSSVGSHIWVTGTGGEFGYNGKDNSSAAVVSVLSRFLPDSYEDWDKGTPWRKNSSKYNGRLLYTHRMNGTSAATPSVTGVSALVIQAKPDITVPQLRYILATTSNNDETPGWSSLQYSPVVKTVPEFDSESMVFDYGWYTNGAGLRFSNYYGFGVVNAKKAVEKAMNCNSDELCRKREVFPSDFKSTNVNPCTSDDDGYTVTCRFTDFAGVDYQETPSSEIDVENVAIDLTSFSYLKNNASFLDDCYMAILGKRSAVGYVNSLLQIDMTSPSGTRTKIKSFYSNWDFEGHVFKKMYPNGEFLINTSDYYTEKVSASDTFTMEFRSKCKIDLDNLNSRISVVVNGYTD